MSILKIIWNFLIDFFTDKSILDAEENLKRTQSILAQFEREEKKPVEVTQAEETIIPPPQEFRDVSKQNNLIPERFAWESFEEYSKRRLLAKEFLKRKKQGITVWNSDKQGTFRGDTSKLK